MAEDQSNDNLPLLRQRRNLIVGALLVLFLETTVSPPNNLSILGVTLEITHADYIVYWLWLFTAYWLIRFLQYLPSMHEIKAAVVHELRFSLKNLVKRMADAIVSEPKDDAQYEFFVKPGHIGIPGRVRLTRIHVTFNTVSQRDRKSGAEGASTGTGTKHEFVVLGTRAVYFNVVAAFDVCIRTPLFTEYLVPILLFIAACASSLHRLF